MGLRSTPDDDIHDWDDGWRRGEQSTCKGCGDTWEPRFVGHQPPKWGCGSLSQSRMNPISEGRRSRRYDDEGNKVVYGPIFKAVSRLPCCVCGTIDGAGAHHVTSVGAGGKDKGNCVPMCVEHHTEVETIGRQSFEKKYDIDLDQAAKVADRKISHRTGA